MLNKDQEYVARVLQGEINAFSPLVQRHQDLVFSICFRVLKHQEEAEEAAQDTFLKAYRSLEKYRGTAAFSTWLYRIAYNTAISRTRKKKMEWTTIDDHTLENTVDAEQDEFPEAVRKEIQEKILAEAVKKLPDPDQLLIELFYVRSLGMEEIAGITELSLSNVKVKMHRIRKKLLKELNKDIFVEPEERELI